MFLLFYTKPLCHKFLLSITFQTIIYLIDPMLILILQHQLSFEKLFYKTSNLQKLNVFNYLCYPWLLPYASYKLTLRSKHCIFIEYSIDHNMFQCYNPQNRRVYVSHHIIFVEFIFLFKIFASSTVRAATTIIHH